MELSNTNNLQNAVDRAMANRQPEPEQEYVEPIETQQVVSQAEEMEPTIAEKQASHKVNTEQEANFKRQREKFEADIKARDDEINRLKQAQKHAKLNDEDLVEGKDWNALNQRILDMEARNAAAERYRQQAEDIQKLSEKYEDFNQVVNKETLKKLEELDPEAFDAVNAAPTLRAGGAAAYRIIKSLDISGTNRVSDRIDENMSKPATGRGNLAKMESFSQRMTDQEKKDTWALVNRLARGG